MFAGFSFSDRLHGQPTVEYPASLRNGAPAGGRSLRLYLLRKNPDRLVAARRRSRRRSRGHDAAPLPAVEPADGPRRPGDEPAVPPARNRSRPLFPLHGRQLPAGGPGVGIRRTDHHHGENPQSASSAPPDRPPFGAGPDLRSLLPADRVRRRHAPEDTGAVLGLQLLPGESLQNCHHAARILRIPCDRAFQSPGQTAE